MTLALLHPATGEPIVDPSTGDTIPPIVTVTEASKLIGLPRNVVTAYCESGQFPAMDHRPGDPWRIPTAKLLRSLGMLPDQTSSPDPSAQGAAPSLGSVADPRAPLVHLPANGSGGDHRKEGSS